MKKLVVIIPAYNEEKSIVKVINQIPRTITNIEKIEILVIDDGSQDKTVNEIKNNTSASVVSHHKNLGLGASFATGLEQAIKRQADIVVTIDADNQFDPQDINKLIKPIIDKKYDCVTGSRFIDKNFSPDKIPFIKKWGNKKVAFLINKLTGQKYYDVSCGFRAYSKQAILNINIFSNFTYTQEVILDLSFKNLIIKEVPIKVRYFADRQSRIAHNLFKYAWNISKTNFRIFRDYKPLKFFGSIGLLIFITGLLFDIFILWNFINTGSITPYKYIGFIGGFLNLLGFLIIIVGLLADMLYRIRINQEKILYYEKRKKYN